MCHDSVPLRHDSFIETWLVHLWHDSVTPLRAKESESKYTQHPYVSWLVHLRHDSFTYDMTRLFVSWLVHLWHDSVICDVTKGHPRERKKEEKKIPTPTRSVTGSDIYIYIYNILTSTHITYKYIQSINIYIYRQTYTDSWD